MIGSLGPVSVVVALAVAFIIGAVAWRRADMAVLLLLFGRLLTDAIHNPNVTSDSTGTVAVSLATILAVSIALLSPDRRRMPPLPPSIVFSFGAFILWESFRAITGAEPLTQGLSEVARWLSYASAGLLAYIGLSRARGPQRLVGSMIGIALGEFLYQLVQLATHTALAYNTSDFSTERAPGTFIHPDWLAFYYSLVVVLVIFVASFRLHSKLVLIGILLTGILLTSSRGPLVFLLLLAVCCSLIRRRPALAFGSLLGAGSLFLLPVVRDRFFSEIVGGQLTGSYATRLQLHDLALQYWHQSPWIGNGTASFSSVFALAHIGYPYEAHSDILKFLADTGIVGLALYLAVAGTTVRCLWTGRLHSWQGYSSAICISVVIYGYIDVLHRINTVQAFIWTIVGLSLGLSAKSEGHSSRRVSNAYAVNRVARVGKG